MASKKQVGSGSRSGTPKERVTPKRGPAKKATAKKATAKKATAKKATAKKATAKKATAKKATAKKATAKKATAKKPAQPAMSSPSANKKQVTRQSAANNVSRAADSAAATPATLPMDADSGSEVNGVGVGDAAPSFVLQDDSGVVVSSESLRGSPYVLYFYPRDDTPGCTLEACGFRDSMPRFSAKGVRVIGVSPDLPDAHARFKKKYGLGFLLLSDPEKTLAKAYGVWVKKLNYGRETMGVLRSTFFVDKKGSIRKVWRAVKVPGHVDAVLHSV